MDEVVKKVAALGLPGVILVKILIFSPLLRAPRPLPLLVILTWEKKM
jgi:hypothetical protein